MNQSHSIDEFESKSAVQTSYHHGDLRAELIRNGLSVLESTQSTEFSLRELTRKIGVSVNAAYRHFANKDELLSEIAAYGFQQLLTCQAEAIQKYKQPKDKFLNAGRAYVEFARQNPALFRLMFGRFATTHRTASLNDLAQLAYEGMRFSTAMMLELPLDAPQVTIRAMQAWSVVHGLSHLIIDGQIHLHTADVNTMVNQILENESL